MSTKLKCGDNPDLYSFWGSRLTEALNEEIESGHVSFVLNVASQEYASSVELAKLKAPVITADFPGPTVYTKEARGQMARYCAQRQVREPSELRGFTGDAGEWSYVASESSDARYVFHMDRAKKDATKEKKQGAAKRKK